MNKICEIKASTTQKHLQAVNALFMTVTKPLMSVEAIPNKWTKSFLKLCRKDWDFYGFFL